MTHPEADRLSADSPAPERCGTHVGLLSECPTDGLACEPYQPSHPAADLRQAAEEAVAAFTAKPDVDELDHPEGLTAADVSRAWFEWDDRRDKAVAALRAALQPVGVKQREDVPRCSECGIAISGHPLTDTCWEAAERRAAPSEQRAGLDWQGELLDAAREVHMLFHNKEPIAECTVPRCKRRVALATTSAGDGDGLAERVAEAIYDAMRENDPEGRNRPWVPRGNSQKQDEARRRAAAALRSRAASDGWNGPDGDEQFGVPRAASVEPFAASGWDPREDPESSLHEPPRCECGELEQNRVHHGVGRTLYHPFRAVSVDDEGTYPGGAVQKAVDEFVMPDDFPGDPDYREPPR
jgi:hypothetical protein